MVEIFNRFMHCFRSGDFNFLHFRMRMFRTYIPDVNGNIPGNTPHRQRDIIPTHNDNVLSRNVDVVEKVTRDVVVFDEDQYGELVRDYYVAFPTREPPLECPICLDVFTPLCVVIVLPCHVQHWFHKTCMQAWNRTCPMCRHPT